MTVDSGKGTEPLLPFEKAKRDFSNNVKSVQALVDFDRYVMDFAIERVNSLHQRLARHDQNPMTNGEHVVEALRRVRENDALRHNYGVIANQAVVLLVSHFGSAIGDVFRAAIPLVHQLELSEKLRREDLRFTLDELVQFASAPDTLGDVFASKKDISFQDMQSIVRAFADYVGVEMPRTPAMNNIVVAQACRHVIVHSGGVVDRQCVRQVSSAVPRSLRQHVVQGEALVFTPAEVTAIAKDMVALVDELIGRVVLRVAPEQA